jgi:hypothetical protein
MGDRAKAMETLVLKCIALEFVAAIASGRKHPACSPAQKDP